MRIILIISVLIVAYVNLSERYSKPYSVLEVPNDTFEIYECPPIKPPPDTYGTVIGIKVILPDLGDTMDPNSLNFDPTRLGEDPQAKDLFLDK